MARNAQSRRRCRPIGRNQSWGRNSPRLAPQYDSMKIAQVNGKPITAHIGLYQSFGSYLGSYEHFIKGLFARLEAGKEPPDMIAPPLLFLMRHAMELGYKYT